MIYASKSLIHLIAPGTCPRDHETSWGVTMRTDIRRDELMKPDVLSECVLTLIGAAIVIFLVMTLWMAMFHH